MSYWLHPDAEAELDEAALYYAKHASRTVAEAFADSSRSQLRSRSLLPLLARTVGSVVVVFELVTYGDDE